MEAMVERRKVAQRLQELPAEILAAKDKVHSSFVAYNRARKAFRDRIEVLSLSEKLEAHRNLPTEVNETERAYSRAEEERVALVDEQQNLRLVAQMLAATRATTPEARETEGGAG